MAGSSPAMTVERGWLGTHIDPETLDHRVGQQLARHLLGLGPGAAGVALGELDLDDLASAHLANPGEAEIGEGVADRLALRVEHALFQHDGHDSLHWISSGPLRSRMPAS